MPVRSVTVPMRSALAVLALLACAVHAGPMAEPVRAEVDGMLVMLENSGCRFGRNGKWHSAAQAKEHLLGKLAYIERVGTLQSAEQFIERAATGSSLTGRAYLVQCGTAEPVASAQWMTAQLQALRAGGGTVPRRTAP